MRVNRFEIRPYGVISARFFYSRTHHNTTEDQNGFGKFRLGYDFLSIENFDFDQNRIRFPREIWENYRRSAMIPALIFLKIAGVELF